MAHYRKRGKNWECLYYAEVLVTDPKTGIQSLVNRQQSQSGFPTKRAAIAWNTQRENDLLRGHAVIPQRQTLADYANDWLATRRPGDYAVSTLNGYRYHIRRNINPALGAVPLLKLDDRRIQSWHTEMIRRGLAMNTIRSAHVVLSILLNDAVRRRVLRENPGRIAGMPGRGRDRKDIQVWTVDEMHAFLTAADDHKHGLIYRLMLMTAVRPGEALTLMWGDIDWQQGTISIRRTRTRDDDGRHIIGDRPKTPASNRVLTLQSGLAVRLRRHRAQQAEYRLSHAGRWHDHDLVFPGKAGMLLHDQTFGDRLRRIIQTAGVPRIPPHGLRHTAATTMIAMGEHMEAVSEILGHESIATTMDLYGHLSESMRRPVAERLEALLDARNDVVMTNRD